MGLDVAYTACRAKKWIVDNVQEHGAPHVANMLGIHNVHVYNAWNTGKVSPTLKWALITKKIFCLPLRRRRFACDVPVWMSPAQADKFRDEMRTHAAIVSSQIAAKEYGQ